ncbi:MAG: YraN family protein [Bacteroidales bacterium]|nr:YraN family protein [Bacteroidales bacterium]
MAHIQLHTYTPDSRTKESRQEAKELGSTGEQIATRYLEDKGYTILERNYHAGKHEVDIITLHEGMIVVVEVKTRTDTQISNPEDAVDHRKRGYIIRVINQYMATHNRSEEVRFDVLSIVYKDHKPDIRHITDAFNILNY